jgi:carbon-monoxide dehydrogenase medium subunit
MLGEGFSGTENDIARLVELAFEDVKPLEDIFADGAYRIHLGKVMLKRALEDTVNQG